MDNIVFRVFASRPEDEFVYFAKRQIVGTRLLDSGIMIVITYRYKIIFIGNRYNRYFGT
jgi:hypothetical protein